MSYSTDYFWVVLCKNARFHRKQNLFHKHTIPLGETDAISPLPVLDAQLKVRCNECGEEYLYKPKEILRAEIEVPKSFIPHPSFAGF